MFFLQKYNFCYNFQCVYYLCLLLAYTIYILIFEEKKTVLFLLLLLFALLLYSPDIKFVI